MQVFLPLLLFPQCSISQSIAGGEKVSSGWTRSRLTSWLGTVLGGKVWWWGWSSSKKHKSRSALALDLTGSRSYAPRLEGSSGVQWQCGMGLGDWQWLGWGAMVLGGGGTGSLSGAEQELAQGPWLMLDAPGPAGSVPSRHPRWGDTPSPGVRPLPSCRQHSKYSFFYFLRSHSCAFQIGLEQEILLSTCYTSPKHASWH